VIQSQNQIGIRVFESAEKPIRFIAAAQSEAALRAGKERHNQQCKQSQDNTITGWCGSPNRNLMVTDLNDFNGPVQIKNVAGRSSNLFARHQLIETKPYFSS
jgi:hypothetical protein